MITSNDFSGPSQADVDGVLNGGGTLTFNLSTAYAGGRAAAAHNLATACELISGRIDLSGRDLLAAEDYEIVVEVRLIPKSK
ncbi:hypothetical protein GCM10010402_52760 [Actinomadura luteofluorescens]|uniref:hypothetical protein n=1 Tax=Actinomadura luteofluorescens TaxID=46163 RepID=UPI002164D169|nr:hypothetical protein [Actinomadura glauciflava]MCR3744376.1 hypothetical protein [Actinomadura glauciflava]